MCAYQRSTRKSENQPDGIPASKKPRVSSNDNGYGFDDDDPFADDITGEELEFIASQAELRHTAQNNQKSTSSKAVGNNFTFTEPQPKTIEKSGTSDTKLISDLKSKLSIYEKKISDLQISFNRKNGETLVLRDRLSNAEKQVHQERMKTVELQHNQQQQNSEREKDMQTKMEKFKDDFQFKQAELQESQNLIRNLKSKVKTLEQQNSTLKSRSPKNTSVNSGNGLSEDGWNCTQATINSLTNPKKIKLIKPESPRMTSAKHLSVTTFTDAPLEKMAKASTSCRVQNPSDACSDALKPHRSRNYHLQSRVLLKKGCGQSILQYCPSVFRYRDVMLSDNVEPPQQSRAYRTDNATFSRNFDSNLRRYLLSNPRCMALFDNSRHASFQDNASGLLDIVRNHIKAFASVQDVPVLNVAHATPENTSSYHTARSDLSTAIKHEKSAPIVESAGIVIKNALSALHLLIAICEHLPGTLQLKENCDLLTIICRLCDIARWKFNSAREDVIIILLLKVLKIHVGCSDNCVHDSFKQVIRLRTLLPLLTHSNIEVQSSAITLLNSAVSSCPDFALDLVKSGNDCPSVLCHVTDVIGAQTCRDDGCWSQLMTEALYFLSNLITNHQVLLIEHSCFSEIYIGVDSLLYSQLQLWKTKSGVDEKQKTIIRSAVCLLHSCINVYPRGIPGYRRPHVHQSVLVWLHEFFEGDLDESTFWNAELGRIIKSEVKSVIEESDSS